MNKLGIVVPYRDREEQLSRFKKHLTAFLKRTLTVPFTIIVVEQSDRKEFNRGKLLNIGFEEAKKQKCTYVIFHDVDMIPIKGDYTYSDKPLQIANKFAPDGEFIRTIQRNYFGGATMFTVKDFEKINGYSNKYKGWGFEDDDLLLRCRELDLELQTETYRVPSFEKRVPYFNGKDSYVRIKNIFNTIRPHSFIATFYPGQINPDPNEITDEYTIFSIPGHDLNLSFNSFNRYKFELFLKDNTPISITSDYLPNLPVQVVVNVNPRDKRIQYFLNGKEVGIKYWDSRRIRLYEEEPYLYLGVADPTREIKPKFYNGHIINFGVLHGEIGRQEVRKLFLSDHNLPITETNPELNDRWNGYYDSKDYSKLNNIWKDTSGYENNGELFNTTLTVCNTPKVVKQTFPYRRPGYHQLIKHDERGYTDGYWKTWSGRENQLRYYRLLNNNDSEYSKDGLSNCKYRIKSREEESKEYTKLNVIT